MSFAQGFDPEAVRAFEHAGWQQAAAHYPATFAAATREYVTALLDAAAVGTRSVVLDVCCGTGIVADAAATHGTVRTAALIDAQRPVALLAIEAEIARGAAAYRHDGWYAAPTAAILGRGAKPR